VTMLASGQTILAGYRVAIDFPKFILIGTVSLMSLMPHVARADDGLQAVQLQIQDHHFSPAQLTLPAGSKAELTVTNLGPGTEELESRSLRIEKLIPAGKTISIKIGPLKSGTYDLFGDFHPETCKSELIVP